MFGAMHRRAGGGLSSVWLIYILDLQYARPLIEVVPRLVRALHHATFVVVWGPAAHHLDSNRRATIGLPTPYFGRFACGAILWA